MAKKMGVRVEVFSFGFGPKIWFYKKGDTEYAISAIPIGGYVKMAGEEPGGELKGEEWEFCSKPIYKRFHIFIAGSAVNYILGFTLFCLIFMIGAPIPTSRIGTVLKGYPAEKVGLKENDKIIDIDGQKVRYWEEVLNLIHNKDRGEEINLVIDRNGTVLNFTVQGKYEERKDIFGKPIAVTLIGIGRSDEVDFVKYNFFKSLKMGARTTWNITALTYRLLWGMVTGAVSIKGAAGPIGIFAITGEAAQMGMPYLLWISALISVSLTIFNLLPIPPLDGGHILFLGIEKIKGGPVDRKIQEIVQQTGWILLITLLLIVSWNDIMRFFK
jgi:regulator of sigma E protease